MVKSVPVGLLASPTLDDSSSGFNDSAFDATATNEVDKCDLMSLSTSLCDTQNDLGDPEGNIAMELQYGDVGGRHNFHEWTTTQRVNDFGYIFGIKSQLKPGFWAH